MVQDKESKSELLRQLTIDKSTPQKTPLSPLVSLLGVAVISLVFGGLGTFFLLGDSQSKEAVTQRDNDKKAPTQNTNPAVASSELAKQAPSQNTSSSTVLNASGYVTPRLVATVSAEVMGLITSVEVEEGMSVEAGQVLARLDDSVAKVNLALAQAQVTVREAQLKSVESDKAEALRIFKRVSSLKGDDYSSEADLTRAKANLDKALSGFETMKADIAVARLQVDQQREFFENHTIRAPFAGMVTVKNAQPGEIVSPSSAGGGFTRTGICTIVDMNSLEIEVDVNEAFIRLVEPGQKVIANLDAYPSWDIPASVIAIIPTADRAKATVRVRIKIEKLDARILPDMGVKVAFVKS